MPLSLERKEIFVAHLRIHLSKLFFQFENTDAAFAKFIGLLNNLLLNQPLLPMEAVKCTDILSFLRSFVSEDEEYKKLIQEIILDIIIASTKLPTPLERVKFFGSFYTASPEVNLALKEGWLDIADVTALNQNNPFMTAEIITLEPLRRLLEAKILRVSDLLHLFKLNPNYFQMKRMILQWIEIINNLKPWIERKLLKAHELLELCYQNNYTKIEDVIFDQRLLNICHPELFVHDDGKGRMLMHYIFLGEPNENLIRDVLTLLRRQVNPAVQAGCHHPRGKLWTLNNYTQTIAMAILNRMEPSSHLNVHIEIMSSTAVLEAAQTRSVVKYTGEAEVLNTSRSDNEREVYTTVTSMIYNYLRMLSVERQRLRHRVVEQSLIGVREYVTAKELMSLWISYTFGGVCLDRGCTAAEAKWGFIGLRPNNFYLPRLARIEACQLRKTTSGAMVFCRDYLIISECNQGLDHSFLLSSFKATSIDNWISVSPVLCKIPLYALQIFLIWLPSPYIFLRNSRNHDEILEDGSGMFSAFHTINSLGALCHGYFTFIVNHPNEALKQGLSFPQSLDELRSSNIISLESTTIPVVSVRIESKFYHNGIVKQVTKQPRNADGVITGGWRAPLTEAQAEDAVRRFEKLEREHLAWRRPNLLRRF